MVAPSIEPPVWIVPERDHEAEARLVSGLGVPTIVAAVLAQRGFKDPERADRFLNPSLDHLHDPALLPDYDQAVAAILSARDKGETVYVHGDYDVDGVTSAALFTRFLKLVGCDVVPHVPHRMREGYGIHLDAVEWAREKGAKLFLTCDCGISAHEQVIAAREAGMTVVVTDHHIVGDTLPEAAAVVNPHRSDSKYPWADLSGVGVAFKLCAGLTKELGHKVENYYRAYLDLAVLGTVADVMPLLDENRVITRFGLDVLSTSKKMGVQALLKVSNLDQADRLTARNIGFQIGPRINAIGRIDDSSHALDLLLTEDPAEAETLAKKLDQVNEERRAEQSRSVDEAVERVESLGLAQNYTLMLHDEGWHPGVIGLVAGRLVERFRRPAFVMTVHNGVAKGSARSIPGFDLGQAIRSVRPVLIGGGGHEMAAGFSVAEDRIPELAAQIEAFAQKTLTPEDFRLKVMIDVEIAASEARPSVMPDLRKLEPFGNANPEPLFSTAGAKLSMVVPTSNPDHAKVTLDTEDGVRQAMAFGIGRALAGLDPGAEVRVAFSVDENVFNGKSSFRWLIRDVQPCAV